MVIVRARHRTNSTRRVSLRVPGGNVQRLARGGTYYRVCGPDWNDPSDTEYSKAHGGRWNAPGAFGALYLNQNVKGARANARRWIERHFGAAVLPEDIAEAFLPDVATFHVETGAFVDAVTDRGRRGLGLPARYPSGEGYPRCRAIGARLYRAKGLGIATVSAVTTQSEELIVFDSAVKRVTNVGPRRRFADWFTPI